MKIKRPLWIASAFLGKCTSITYILQIGLLGFFDYNIITKAGFEITWFPTLQSIKIMRLTSLLVNHILKWN